MAWRDVPSNVAVSDLVFVPGLLKPTFEGAGIKTVDDLLSRDITQFQVRVGWGKQKTALLAALQSLYRNTIQGSVVDRYSRVGAVAAPELLPDIRLSQMTVCDFVNSSAEDWGLKGRKKEDFDDLKRLFISPRQTISGE